MKYDHDLYSLKSIKLIRALGGGHSREHFPPKMICSRNDKSTPSPMIGHSHFIIPGVNIMLMSFESFPNS